MLQPRSIHSSLGLKDKILSFDYILVISILVLGIISMLAMYSTDGGEFKYHTNSHILRFFVFFGLFFLVSLVKIRFWHDQSFLIYFFFLYITSRCKIFWTNIFWFKTMARSLFYEFTTIRINEDRLNFIFSKILSSYIHRKYE